MFRRHVVPHLRNLWPLAMGAARTPRQFSLELLETRRLLTVTLQADPVTFAGPVFEGAYTGAVDAFHDDRTGAQANEFVAEVSWGDGSPPSPGRVNAEGNGTFQVEASHTYEPGSYFPTVTITDVVANKSTKAKVPSSWASVAPLPFWNSGLAAATGHDGRIYAIGGTDEATITGKSEVYDPTTNSWTPIAVMPQSRATLAAATAPDGKIYAIGGVNQAVGSVSTVEAYDPATNTWSTAAPMPTARTRLAAVAGHDGRIYAMGGETVLTALNTLEIYDPATNTWSKGAPMPQPSAGLAAAVGPDGRIYALGGYDASGDIINTVQVYDPATDSWSLGPAMPLARYNIAAATGPYGRIFVMGGHDNTNGAPFYEVDAYDPATSTWTAAAQIPTWREEPAAVTGADGRIYAIGGTTTTVNSVEALSLAPIQVSDAPLTATPATLAAQEGATFNSTLATFSDSSLIDPAADFTATIDWGDGVTSAGTVTGANGLFTVGGAHVYWSTGTPLVRVSVSDAGGAMAIAEPRVSIVDAPLSGASVAITSGEFASYSGVTARFTDANPHAVAADYAVTIDWGDGASSEGTASPAPGGGFQVSGSHFYAEDGSYVVQTKIVDEGGATLAVSSSATIAKSVISATAVAVSGFERSPLDVAVATFQQGTGGEPVSNFTAAIDWGDGASSVGTVSLVAGVYTVEGSHAYADERSFPIKATIEDSAAGDTASATIDTTATILEELLPGGVRGTADQRWISETYRNLLNRPVDPTGLSHWGSLLAAGKSREQIVQQIETTHEFVGDEVEQLYQRYLHRSPDAAGLAYFSRLLEAGKTVERVSALLAGSDEFFSVQGGGTNDGFLGAVYQDALGRPLDSAGRAWWKSQLSAGATRTQVVDQILSTQEHRQDVVKHAYEQLLDRQADATGLNGWVAGKRADATDQQLFAHIAASQEFYDKSAP